MMRPLSMLSARSARLLLLAAVALALGMAPARAAADSLVYVAGGHVQVANGRHTFAVEAIDGKGKVDGTPATARFKV